MSQYDDRSTSARTSVSSRPGPGAARGDEYGRGYREYDYERPSARRDDDYEDDGYDSLYPPEPAATTALPPPRGFDDEPAAQWKIGWTSGTDLGLLAMRVVLGGIFAAHGAQKVLGWFNGAGLDGFAAFLAERGFEQADALSAATAFAELVGGLLVILGVFTPLAAAGLLSVMINAIWLQWNSGLFAADGGFELQLALAALATGLIFTGPGRVALDNGRAWFRHPVATGWICLLLGAGTAVTIYVMYHGL